MRIPLLIATILLIGCKADPTDSGTSEPPGKNWECAIDEDAPDWADQVGCWEDFGKIASEPLDASIPGARSAKTVVDRIDGDRLYFTNSQVYPIHWDFASQLLSGNGLPFVPELGTFNGIEYTTPDRRFILGAITYYEEPDVWAYEIAPYDTADTEMIATAYRGIRDNAYFGEDLYFHPSSEAQAALSEGLDADINIITTDELFAGITYQPLNLGTTMGLLTFHTAEEVDGQYTNFREIVVLDKIPNDISIVAGIITDAFQTPLSHINVLSQNRGTPNMSLIGAWDDPELRALEGKWVELTVGPFEPTYREVTQADAEAWWEANRPEPLETVPMDLSVQEMTNTEDILQLDTMNLSDALHVAIPAYGGKASHFGGLSLIGDECPVPKAFAIPVFFYNQFMEENGFWDRVEAWDTDPDFANDPAYRHEQLEQLQADMLAGTINPTTYQMVLDKLAAEYPGVRMRFRSSTNAEDLGDFTGAGLYTSNSGNPDDPAEPVDMAMKATWSSVWNPRAFEERDYYSIDHRQVGMSLLCHQSFPEEEANGVAITNNIFDTSGLEPAFYVNAQIDNWSVVLPELGVLSDSYLHYFDQPNQPITYLQHSNLVPPGQTVLTTAQSQELGVALAAIRTYFMPAYGDRAFYAMDTEFKFDDDGVPGATPHLYMKQARPYPGWGDTSGD